MDDRDIQEKLSELQDEVCIHILIFIPRKIIYFFQYKYLTRSYSLPLKHHSLLCSTK
jgi:hypothetical protein